MIRTKPITALRPFHGGKTHLAYSPYRSGLTRFSVQLLLRPLVLDVRLPDLSGLDLQRELRKSDIEIPIIFITGHGDIPMTVEAMKAGAVEFLTKPFRGQNLLEAVQGAIARDRAARQERAEIAELRKCFDTLSPREREVLGMVVTGLLNKQIAAELGISELTVKTHRAHIMEKMRAGSLAELVHITDCLQSVPPRE